MIQVKNVNVESKGFGNITVTLTTTDDQKFSWSGAIHMFSYTDDLEKALTQLTNQILAAYTKGPTA